jgi:hypothetical protein
MEGYTEIQSRKAAALNSRPAGTWVNQMPNGSVSAADRQTGEMAKGTSALRAIEANPNVQPR